MKIDYRILVSGFFNAGKTTLIHALDKDAFSIETHLSDFTKKAMADVLRNSNKQTTTTGFDRGVVVWARTSLNSSGFIVDLREYSENKEDFKDLIVKFVELKGVPGQLHFNVVRETISNGMHGTLLVIDGSDLGSIGSAIEILEETKIYMKDKPIVIVANKSDLPAYIGKEQISDLTGGKTYESSALYNIGIKDALIDVLTQVEKTVLLENRS